jgi:hypothetical protein
MINEVTVIIELIITEHHNKKNQHNIRYKTVNIKVDISMMGNRLSKWQPLMIYIVTEVKYRS